MTDYISDFCLERQLLTALHKKRKIERDKGWLLTKNLQVCNSRHSPAPTPSSGSKFIKPYTDLYQQLSTSRFPCKVMQASGNTKNRLWQICTPVSWVHCQGGIGQDTRRPRAVAGDLRSKCEDLTILLHLTVLSHQALSSSLANNPGSRLWVPSPKHFPTSTEQVRPRNLA